MSHAKPIATVTDRDWITDDEGNEIVDPIERKVFAVAIAAADYALGYGETDQSGRDDLKIEAARVALRLYRPFKLRAPKSTPPSGVILGSGT